jgi:membrane protein DedA with SNARE-associated domain
MLAEVMKFLGVLVGLAGIVLLFFGSIGPGLAVLIVGGLLAWAGVDRAKRKATKPPTDV